MNHDEKMMLFNEMKKKAIIARGELYQIMEMINKLEKEELKNEMPKM